MLVIDNSQYTFNTTSRSLPPLCELMVTMRTYELAYPYATSLTSSPSPSSFIYIARGSRWVSRMYEECVKNTYKSSGLNIFPCNITLTQSRSDYPMLGYYGGIADPYSYAPFAYGNYLFGYPYAWVSWVE